MLLHSRHYDLKTQEPNIHLLGDPATGTALMIDAGAPDPDLVAWVADQALDPPTILLTHLHWDHVDGLPDYLEAWPGARVHAPAPLETAPGLELVKHGQTLEIGPFEIRVLSTPGHRPESVSYYLPRQGLLFTGDTLFAGTVGGTPDQAAYDQQLGAIREHLLALPDEVEIHSGHGPMTTIGLERACNPFLQPGFARPG